MSHLIAPHSVTAAEVARALEADLTRGLSEQDARERLSRVGRNALERRRRPAYLTIAARQLVDPLGLDPAAVDTSSRGFH